MTNKLTLSRTLPYILIAAGIIGTLASLALTYDKIQVLQNASYQPNCNLNPVFSCVSVMKSEQANLFGIPNTIFGIMGFTALTTLGFIIMAGAQLKKWIWIAVQVFATAGVVFMHYLFFQAVYRIGAICPWCFVVWMITIPTFLYITLYNFREGNIKISSKLNKTMQENHGNILLLWYVVIFGILLYEFWYYWSTLI